jgi:L-fuconolactonase
MAFRHMIVDAHHHVWDPGRRAHAWLDGRPALRRRFSAADFTQVAADHGVSASVLVQVLASAAETEEFLALAAAAPAGTIPAGTGPAGPPGVIAGVVGWADLTAPDVASEIARLRQLPGGSRLAGIRHLVEDEPDPGWLDRPDVRHGIRAVGDAGLPYDLLVGPAQLPAALRVISELDGVRFVLDHGAKPDIASGRLEPWFSLVTELSHRPNVTCKLSGLVTEAAPGWTVPQIVPYAAALLDCFGPGRLMFGSDWPVCTLAASYGDVLAVARAALDGPLSAAELDAVFAANAIATYRLRLDHDPLTTTSDHDP